MNWEKWEMNWRRKIHGDIIGDDDFGEEEEEDGEEEEEEEGWEEKEKVKEEGEKKEGIMMEKEWITDSMVEIIKELINSEMRIPCSLFFNKWYDSKDLIRILITNVQI